MSKSFDPRYVLRQVTNELLEDLLEGQSQTVDVPWNELKETQIEPIFAAWQSMPMEPRRAIELILHDVFSMANDHGVRAIMEEANRQGNTSLLDDLAGDVSRFDIAMRTCLQADAVWSVASQFAKADEVSGGRYLHGKRFATTRHAHRAPAKMNCARSSKPKRFLNVDYALPNVFPACIPTRLKGVRFDDVPTWIKQRRRSAAMAPIRSTVRSAWQSITNNAATNRSG